MNRFSEKIFWGEKWILYLPIGECQLMTFTVQGANMRSVHKDLMDVGT